MARLVFVSEGLIISESHPEFLETFDLPECTAKATAIPIVLRAALQCFDQYSSFSGAIYELTPAQKSKN